MDVRSRSRCSVETLFGDTGQDTVQALAVAHS